MGSRYSVQQYLYHVFSKHSWIRAESVSPIFDHPQRFLARWSSPVCINIRHLVGLPATNADVTPYLISALTSWKSELTSVQGSATTLPIRKEEKNPGKSSCQRKNVGLMHPFNPHSPSRCAVLLLLDPHGLISSILLQPYRAPRGRSCKEEPEEEEEEEEDGVGSKGHRGGDWNVFYLFLHNTVDFSKVNRKAKGEPADGFLSIIQPPTGGLSMLRCVLSEFIRVLLPPSPLSLPSTRRAVTFASES